MHREGGLQEEWAVEGHRLGSFQAIDSAMPMTMFVTMFLTMFEFTRNVKDEPLIIRI